MKKLLPIINHGIYKSVIVAGDSVEINNATLNDHRLLMDFLQASDAKGAEMAMRLHIVHAISAFGFNIDDFI